METLKGITKALLIAVLLLLVPVILLIIGPILTVVGPIVGIIIIIGFPFISLGVIIGVKQKKKEKVEEG